MLAFRKNNSNGEVIEFGVSKGIDESLNQKIN